MGMRKTPALAPGEYVQGHPARSETTVVARARLMDACRRVFPAMLEDFRTTVYQPYEASAKTNPTAIGRRRDPFPRTPTLEHQKICDLVEGWAHRYNAMADWILDGAFQVLPLWLAHPKMRQALAWFAVPVIRDFDIGKPFFTHIPWNPQLQTWAGYKPGIKKAPQLALRAYGKAAHQQAMELGLVPARRQYSTANLEWFVLYQFAGLSSVQIADRYAMEDDTPPEPSTVLKGVQTAVELIGWEHLRASRRGSSRKR